MEPQQLNKWYGDGNDGSCPTEQQWRSILSQPAHSPIVLINFFKLRELARYDTAASSTQASISGADAFNQYASVSIPTMESVGGKFLHVGSFGGVFLGNDAQWDIVAIGSYPNLDALLALYTDKHYRQAFKHRTAACEYQQVLIAGV